MRKVLGILLYVVAGFFFYTVALLGFVRTPSIGAKAGTLLAFVIPALIALCLGLAVNRFLNWRKHAGIVLLSASGFTAFIVLTFVCFLLTDEFRKMMKPDTLAFFSDYVIGALGIVGQAGLGAWLLKRKTSERDPGAQSEASSSPPASTA